jgi:hypothetical protein
MFNVKIRQVIRSRNLIWLDKDDESWGLKKQNNQSVFGDPIGDDDSDTTINILISKETEIKAKSYPSSMKLYNQMNRLKSWFSSEASKVMKGLLSGRESMLAGVDVVFFLAYDSGKPTKFNEKYNHPEPGERLKWRMSFAKSLRTRITKEYGEWFQRRRYQKEEDFKRANGYSKLRQIGSSSQDWWRLDTSKYLL